jgi:hypothetical protein
VKTSVKHAKLTKGIPPVAPRRRNSSALGELTTREIKGLPKMQASKTNEVRLLSSAPDLHKNTLQIEHDAMQGNPSQKDLHLPISGPLFRNMQPSRNLEIPRVNEDSSQFFALSYETDDLPKELLIQFQSNIGSKSQIVARLKSADRLNMPHSNAPAQSKTELIQVLTQAEPKDDEIHTSEVGEVTVTNDTFRICAVGGCGYLSHCVLTRKTGETSLICHGTCSSYCQEVLCRKAAERAEKSGSNSRFLYPVAYNFPRMTTQAWTIWKARWKRELNSRQSIADAFDSYRDLYGEETSIEVQNMARADPKTSAELPKYPSFAMRTKTGPLLEEGDVESADASPVRNTADALPGRDTAGMLHSVDSGAGHDANIMRPPRKEQVAEHVDSGAVCCRVVKVQCLSKAYKYPFQILGSAGGSILESVRPVFRIGLGKLPPRQY